MAKIISNEAVAIQLEDSYMDDYMTLRDLSISGPVDLAWQLGLALVSDAQHNESKLGRIGIRYFDALIERSWRSHRKQITRLLKSDPDLRIVYRFTWLHHLSPRVEKKWNRLAGK